jgi:ABC-type glycerol-3-phosphate transport system substrate-binding protein
MKLVVRDFGSYEDYLEIFPRAVYAKTSPDVIVVPNHGGHILLDPYIVYLGEDSIDFKDFETRYHPLFVDELIFEEKQKVNGSNQLVRGIRGIPVGFEPMGIYYNRKIISSVPLFWDKIPELITEEGKTNTIPTLSL